MKNDASGDSGILSGPVSFLRSGRIDFNSISLDTRGSNGNYWSTRSASDAGSYYLYFLETGLYSQNYNYRGNGFAVRCITFQFPYDTII